MENVTNRLLAELLIPRRRQAPTYGWPEPIAQQSASQAVPYLPAEPEPRWTDRWPEAERPRPHGLGAAEDWSRSPRSAGASPPLTDFTVPQVPVPRGLLERIEREYSERLRQLEDMRGRGPRERSSPPQPSGPRFEREVTRPSPIPRAPRRPDLSHPLGPVPDVPGMPPVRSPPYGDITIPMPDGGSIGIGRRGRPSQPMDFGIQRRWPFLPDR